MNASEILSNVTQHPLSITALFIFFIAYILVIIEEFTQLRKSKPVMIAAGLLWIIVAFIAYQQNNLTLAETAVRKRLLDYGELFLFLIVAITYINALEDRNVFQAIRAWLIQKQLSYRQIFWITGFMAFFISPFADNLTTALALSGIILAVGKDKPQFIILSCINLVVAANAGGVFSPFGDITTLMVWQAGIVPFQSFFKLFIPALVNFLIPAICMHFAVPMGDPSPLEQEVRLITGAKRILLLFILTILTTILLHHFLHLPAVVGMMLGLGYLQIFAYYSKLKHKASYLFDIFPILQKVEWDTLLFFYGIILCIGALSTLGYLHELSDFLYHSQSSQTSLSSIIPQEYQLTLANSLVGILSAVIDNIPVMFSIITMKPNMDLGQWLLVTLTTGVGGSLLSIGSAAGVALMGQSRGHYNFLSHLKWTPVIFLGYVISIIVHLI